MFLFNFRTTCKLRMASYVSPSLSRMKFCAYFKHNSKPLAAITLAHIKRITYYTVLRRLHSQLEASEKLQYASYDPMLTSIVVSLIVHKYK